MTSFVGDRETTHDNDNNINGKWCWNEELYILQKHWLTATLCNGAWFRQFPSVQPASSLFCCSQTQAKQIYFMIIETKMRLLFLRKGSMKTRYHLSFTHTHIAHCTWLERHGTWIAMPLLTLPLSRMDQEWCANAFSISLALLLGSLGCQSLSVCFFPGVVVVAVVWGQTEMVQPFNCHSREYTQCAYHRTCILRTLTIAITADEQQQKKDWPELACRWCSVLPHQQNEHITLFIYRLIRRRQNVCQNSFHIRPVPGPTAKRSTTKQTKKERAKI